MSKNTINTDNCQVSSCQKLFDILFRIFLISQLVCTIKLSKKLEIHFMYLCYQKIRDKFEDTFNKNVFLKIINLNIQTQIYIFLDILLLLTYVGGPALLTAVKDFKF